MAARRFITQTQSSAPVVQTYTFTVRSDDRTNPNDPPSNANFILPVSLVGIRDITLEYFQSFNTLPNIRAQENMFNVNFTAGAPHFFTIPPGGYEIEFGTVTRADAAATPADEKLNDLAYVLLREFDPELASVTYSSVTGLLELDWEPAVVGAQLDPSSTINPWAFFGNHLPPNPFSLAWTSSAPLDLGGASSVLLTSNEFANNQYMSTTQSGSNVIAQIPVTSSFLTEFMWEPTNPITFNTRNRQSALSGFTIRIVDPRYLTLTPLARWSMALKFSVTSLPL